MQVLLNVEKATVVMCPVLGDTVLLTLNDDTAFPSTKDDTVITIKTEKGCGEDWCKLYLGIYPKVIQMDDLVGAMLAPKSEDS